MSGLAEARKDHGVKPLLAGAAFAIALFLAFRLAGPSFFIESRAASNLHAALGAGGGLAMGWLAARGFGGLHGAVLFAVPGLLLMAAITSHFSLALPNLDPRLDKGFGGLMLWLYGFALLGGMFNVGQARKEKSS